MRDPAEPQRSDSRAVLRALLGLAALGLFAIGSIFDGPLAAVASVVGGVTFAVVLILALRSGWVLLI